MPDQPQIVYVPVPTPPPPSALSRIFTWMMRSLFVLSLLLNLLILYVAFNVNLNDSLPEKHYSGSLTASRKVALVRVDGVIMEGLIDSASRQLRSAALDPDVEAVVLAVNSPGGSVTASDTLWKQVKDLQDGKWPDQKKGKPVVVSMGGIAASGGYYIAAPARTLFAQPTTVTGSIGVYAQLLNVAKLAEQHGVEATLLKKGELKGSGSLFKPLTPEERQEFDDLLEHTYQRFLQVVREGRGERLKHDLREPIEITSASDPKKKYTRRLADGGGFTADEALRFGLVDRLGYLDEALAEAQRLAGGDPETLRVVTYARPFNLWESLLGIRQGEPERFTLNQIPGLTARLWYLVPGYELAAVPLPSR